MDEIIPILRNNFLTKHLSNVEIESIAKSMQPKIFKDGDIIIRYGDTGFQYYILARGSVTVNIYEKGANPDDEKLESKLKLTKVLESGVGFGELALLYGDRRSATIKSNGICETYVLDGILFKQMIV
jgi:CRP-like cAMP-binding protein